MKILGIDYGTKRVGVAVADTETNMAFPKAVLPNDKFLFGEIKNLAASSGIEKIIIGESKNLDGKDNKIMQDIKMFKRMLEVDLQIEVDFEPEFFTTAEAARLQGEGAMIDASAAAIILQSYLNKIAK